MPPLETYRFRLQRASASAQLRCRQRRGASSSILRMDWSSLSRDCRTAASQLLLPVFVSRIFTPTGLSCVAPRPRHSLSDAIQMSHELRAVSSADLVCTRAAELFERAPGHGTIAIRTHVDVDKVAGTRSNEGVVRTRAAVGNRIDVTIVALATSLLDPATRDGEGRLRWAVDAGAELLGALPASRGRGAQVRGVRIGSGISTHRSRCDGRQDV
jgi:hypothetical protein